MFGKLVVLNNCIKKRIKELGDNKVMLDNPFPRDTDNIEDLLIYWCQKLNYEFNNEPVEKNFDNVVRILYFKNADYGNSVFTKPHLCDVSVDEAIRVRLSDKRNRYLNLHEKDKTTDKKYIYWESVADTVVDIIGYYILLWLWRNKD